MRRALVLAGLIGAWTVGCQLVSGVNDLEVVDEASGGTTSSGGAGGVGSGGTLAAGGTQGGTAGSSTGGSSAGSSAMGGSATGGSATGGSAGEGPTTTASGGTGGNCTDEPGWECDIVSLCGCSSNENCSYNIDTNRTACGRAGDTEPYQRCDVNADCTRGHGCIGGLCKQHCVTADDCGWDNATCLAVYDNDEPIEAFGYCSEACNPVEPTEPVEGGVACDDDSICYAFISDDDSLQSTCAAPSGDGVQGDTCDDGGQPNALACAPGYLCDATDLTCRRFCNPGGDDVCEGGTTCFGFNPPAVLGDNELGYCNGCDTGEFVCSVFPDCGCASGESCKIENFETGATECFAEGAEPPWGTCTVQADCSSEGGACVGGFCYPHCGEVGDDTCAIGDCFQAINTATTEPIPGALYCNAPCEPVLADRASADNTKPCPDDHLCLPVSEDPTDLDTGAFCAPSEGGVEGSECDRNDQCADGLGCLESQCTPYCRNSADCTDMFPTCVNLTTPIYAGPGDAVKQCYN